MPKPTFIPTVRTTTLLDREGMKRSDAAFISTQLASKQARFMILADLKPVINASADKKSGSLRWFNPGDIARLELGEVKACRHHKPLTPPSPPRLIAAAHST